MTTAVEAIRTVLIADAPVAALVGTKVFANKAPDGTVAPYVVCRVISHVDENTFTLEAPIGNVRLQVDSYASGYLAAHAVADAINEVLRLLSSPPPGLSCWRIGERDLFDDEAKLDCASADYSVFR